MRKLLAITLLVALVLGSFSGRALADQETGAMVVTKLFRGIANAATGWMEIPKQMSLVWQESSLQMEWCVGCHRNPGGKIQPRETVTLMEESAPAADSVETANLLRDYKIQTRTDCSTCHR